jgi:gliding motility associated protien GldN
MKKRLLLKSIVVVIMGCFVGVANAQAKKTVTKPFIAKPQQQDPFGNPAANNNAPKANNDPFSAPANNNKPDNASAAANTNGQAQQQQKSDTVPYVTVPSSGGNPLVDASSPSLRNDYAVTQSSVRDQIPLPFDPIREDDAVYTQRVWSVIDTREKMNLPFRNPREDENGSQLFFVILYKSVTEGGVKPIEDERFKKPISKERFLKDYTGGYDTVPVHGDLDNPDLITKYEIRPNEFPVDSVYKFMLKEDYIFDKESSKLVRRIIGIAPMMPPMVKGKMIEGIGNEAFPKFWLYYDDIRAFLAKYRVFNPKNFNAVITWDDLFQAHLYSSYIVKSTKDNPKDLWMKDYINDPLFRLLEGDKIKTAIFDYEQNMWQY